MVKLFSLETNVFDYNSKIKYDNKSQLTVWSIKHFFQLNITSLEPNDTMQKPLVFELRMDVPALMLKIRWTTKQKV